MMSLVKALEADNNDLRKQLETAIISANVQRATFEEESNSLK